MGPQIQELLKRMEPQLEELLKRTDRLSDQFSELRDGIRKAVSIADDDVEMALVRARKVLEYIIRDVHERRANEPPGARALDELVKRVLKDGHLPERLGAYAETIRRLGNVGAHGFGERVTEADVYRSLTSLLPILEWYFQEERPEAGLRVAPSPEKPAATPRPSRRPANFQAGAHIPVVPKGLRSFDVNDSDFFLQLLPGPRDQDGLPESLRFWKHRIEAVDEVEFTVGVIYGPSGCGKSSLVRAGLLPRLDERVIRLHVESTPDATETRLLNGLRKHLPDLRHDLDLTDTIAALRHGQGLRSGQKVLVVLDQFEQWLHTRRREQDPELARALRQCDGEHAQCIMIVRDDFWVALNRFMGDLYIEILQGKNAALVDLFDPIHARKVLTEFGRAYGRLPQGDESLTTEQDSFLTQTIEGLAQDGRVTPIRLALFADMVKGRPWSPATLEDVGGTQGIGVAFLEETFSSPTLRSHLKAAQGVLKALLPEGGTNIKGHMRSYEDLVVASGRASQPGELDNLLRTLDRDVRLITPTDPEATEIERGEQPSPTGQYYQLTHDYLVPSIREWLTRKQRENRRGRAELRLADRAALWEAKPENRHLPSVFEWARIRALTRRKDWTEPQRRMMRRAARFHGLRALGLAILIALGTWGGIEAYGQLHSAELVTSLETAGTAEVPRIIERMARYRRWTDPRLVRMIAESEPSNRAHLHARLALLPSDPTQAGPLYDRLIGASPADLRVLLDLLDKHKARLVPRLWPELEKAKPGDPSLLASAAALARYDPEDPRWADRGAKAAEALVSLNPILLGDWLEVLRPVRRKLTAPLETIFRGPSRPEGQHDLATSILADYAADDPGRLAELMMVSDPKSYVSLFPVVERYEARAIPVFQAELAKIRATPEKDTEPARDERAERQARAAVALVRLGHGGEVWPLLRHSADPRLRSFIVNWLQPLGADPRTVASELARLDSPSTHHAPPATQKMEAILFHPDTSTRRALIIALGTYGTDGLSPGEREPLIARLLDLYEHDPDAGIHGAVEWTLRQWKQQEKFGAIQTRLRGKDRGDRSWYVNTQGQTLVLVEGPVEFRMGSPPSEPDRFTNETARQQVIPRRFAIAAMEVTIDQYQQFANETPGIDDAGTDRYSPDPKGPINGVSWYHAAAYCNWLSRKEHLPECYELNERRQYAEGMRIKADALKLTGYRLPTEAEWEYAARAGALTSRHYGVSERLLGRYAWYLANSKDRAWPGRSLQPNDLGLFDMLGNLYEWCQERYANELAAGTSSGQDEHINENPRLLRGGSFSYLPALVRSAFRYRLAPANRGIDIGFRPSRTYD
jgi:formylglycine-generating enzyme required for sulfatase activity